MAETHLNYYPKEDILYLLIAEGQEMQSVELSPNITAELDAHGELLGLEIVQASNFVRDVLLDTVQGKLLNLGATSNQAKEVRTI